MTITNTLELINPKEITKIGYHTIKKYYFLDVCLNEDKMVKFPLCNGFQIHQCNEFLRSLNLIREEVIKFRDFCGGFGYLALIENCNKLLEIRKTMEGITGKEYNQIGVTAEQVRSCILDQLSAKYKRNILTEAYQTDALDKYVAEALTYFK